MTHRIIGAVCMLLAALSGYAALSDADELLQYPDLFILQAVVFNL